MCIADITFFEIRFIRCGGAAGGCGNWVISCALGVGAGVVAAVGVRDAKIDIDEILVDGRYPCERISAWEGSPLGGGLQYSIAHVSRVVAGLGGGVRHMG